MVVLILGYALYLCASCKYFNRVNIQIIRNSTLDCLGNIFLVGIMFHQKLESQPFCNFCKFKFPCLKLLINHTVNVYLEVMLNT